MDYDDNNLTRNVDQENGTNRQRRPSPFRPLDSLGFSPIKFVEDSESRVAFKGNGYAKVKHETPSMRVPDHLLPEGDIDTISTSRIDFQASQGNGEPRVASKDTGYVKTPLMRTPDNLIASGDLETSSTSMADFQANQDRDHRIERPKLCMEAKLAHMNPMGGIEDSESEYHKEYNIKDIQEARPYPEWFTWDKSRVVTPFGTQCQDLT